MVKIYDQFETRAEAIRILGDPSQNMLKFVGFDEYIHGTETLYCYETIRASLRNRASVDLCLIQRPIPRVYWTTCRAVLHCNRLRSGADRERGQTPGNLQGTRRPGRPHPDDRRFHGDACDVDNAVGRHDVLPAALVAAGVPVPRTRHRGRVRIRPASAGLHAHAPARARLPVPRHRDHQTQVSERSLRGSNCVTWLRVRSDMTTTDAPRCQSPRWSRWLTPPDGVPHILASNIPREARISILLYGKRSYTKDEDLLSWVNVPLVDEFGHVRSGMMHLKMW